MVNTAARLAGYAAKRGIRVACLASIEAEVLDDPCGNNSSRKNLACTQLSVLPAGEVKLKGKEKQVAVCEVQILDDQDSTHGPKASTRGAKRAMAKRMFGREQEMAAVLGFAHREGVAALGLGSIMVVKGSSGIGKSALLSQVAAKLSGKESSGEGRLTVAHAQVLANETRPLHAAEAALMALLEAHGEPLWGPSCRLEVRQRDCFPSPSGLL